MSKFTLNFANSPVPVEAVEAALKEQQEAQQKERALLYAQDVKTCQNAVDAGKRALRAKRKALREFESEFKKLESCASAIEFAQVYNSLSIKNQIGVNNINLVADYEDEIAEA